MESAENPCAVSCALFQVEILTGKDNGKQGRVSMVMRPRNAVIVEGLNTVSIMHTSMQACVVCVVCI